MRPHYETAFEHTVLFATDGLKAERVIVMYNGNGRLHGFQAENLWTSEPLSLSTLETMVADAKDSLVLSAMDCSGHPLSIQLVGIHSMMFVPLKNPTGQTCGFVYLDSRIQAGAFKAEDLEQLKTVIEGSIEPALHQTGACRPLNWEILQQTYWI